MSDTQSFTLDLDTLAGIGKAIAETDQRIGAASGNDDAVRESVTNEFAEQNEEAINKLIKNILTALEKADLGVVIGFTSMFDEAVNDAFADKVDELIEARMKEFAGTEDVDKLKATRKEQMDQFKAIKSVLETTFKIDTSSVAEPKFSRKAGGSKSGGRNKEEYRYSVDGKEVSRSLNVFSALAYHATLGCAKDDKGEDDRWGVKKLKEYINSQDGVTWGKPGVGTDEWTVTLPNNKKVGARRLRADEFVDAPTSDEAENTEEAAA